MIVVRNVFQLKFGKAREAVAIGKDCIALFRQLRDSEGNPAELMCEVRRAG